MDDTIPWILFVVFLGIIIFLVYYVYVYRRPSPFPTTVSNVGVFGFCDKNNTCESSLVCDNKQCKEPLGGACKDVYICTGTAETCKDNKCSRVGTGELNSECVSVCNPGLTCFNHICKIPTGLPCVKSADCIGTDSCAGGVCLPTSQLGQPCVTGQCATGLHCSLGFCQKDGTETGNAGAYCGSNHTVPLCNTSLACVRNVCQAPTQTLSQICDATNICFPPYGCVGGICKEVIPCVVDGDCLPNHTCLSGVCRGVVGQACNTIGVCLSGATSCSTSNTVMIFNNTNNTSGTTLGPVSGTISRIYVSVDTVYVITDTGLYSITPSQSTTTWNKVLDNPTSLSIYTIPPISGKTIVPLSMMASIIDISPVNGQIYIVLKDNTQLTPDTPLQYRLLNLTTKSYVSNNDFDNTTFIPAGPTTFYQPYAGVQIDFINQTLAIGRFVASPYNNFYIISPQGLLYDLINGSLDGKYQSMFINITDVAPYGGSDLTSNPQNVVINQNNGVALASGQLTNTYQQKPNTMTLSSFFDPTLPFSQNKIISSNIDSTTYQAISGIWYNTPYFASHVAAGRDFYAIVISGICT